LTVQLRVDVRDTASEGLRQLMLRTRNISDVLDEIGSSLVTSTQARFEKEESPEGDPWADHSEATKKKRGDDASILRNEIHLYNITHAVSGSKVMVGTNLIYGRIHQLGGEAGRVTARVTIPARPYLGLSDADREEIAAIVTERVEGLR
jgi:phage virion morphogenesis protein